MDENTQTDENDQSNKPPQPDEKLLTVDDLAAYLQVSAKTVYRMVRRSQLPCYRIAGLWRFRKESIDRWLEQYAVDEKKVVGGRE